MNQQSTVMRMGPKLTPLTKKIIIALVAIYVAQLIAENWMGFPVTSWLAWWGVQGEGWGMFRVWQPASAFLINGPSPFSAVIDWLILFFFLPPAEQTLGKRGVFSVCAFSWLAAVLLALPLIFLSIIQVPQPYLGLNCFLTALIVVFGLSRPRARILLFFVIPIRAAWVAWGTGFLAFLFFLYSRNLESAVALFGWGGAVAWMYAEGSPSALMRKLRMRRFVRRARPRPRRFDVIEGGKGQGDDDDPWVH